MNPLFAKRVSTNLLKCFICLIGLIVLALCIFALPSMLRGATAEFPMASQSILLIIIGLYITAIPFFIGLWQTLKLLRYIDQQKTFSASSVSALRNIKRSAITIGIVYLAFVPLLFPIADADDAPGLLLIGAAIACIPLVFAVFVGVLQRLLQNAIDIKSENDLTV